MNLKRIGLALFVVAWIIALVYSVTAGGTSPERLDDATARAIETNCRTARRELTGLRPLALRATPADTATRLDRENEIFTRMLDGQRAQRPMHTTPEEALKGWIGDWQRLIAARVNYAADLRTKGPDARFVEPAYKGVNPIADKMNTWILEQGTRTNTCNTDALQAEVVNGPRVYRSTK